MAFGGYVVAMALGALVAKILSLSDDAIDRVAPVIMFGGAGVGCIIWAILYVRYSMARGALARIEGRMRREEAKIGCGACSDCRSRQSLDFTSKTRSEFR